MKSSKYSIRLFLLVFSAIFLIIASIAYLVYYSQRLAIRNEKSGEPGAFPKLIEKQFLDWKHKRVSDVLFLKNNPAINYHFEQFLRTPENIDFKENLMKISNSIIGAGHYKSLFFLNKTGRPVLSFPEYTKWDPSYIMHIRFLDSAELTDGIIMTNRHFSPDSQKIFDLIAPLTKVTLWWNKCAGFLLLIIDPIIEFYLLLQTFQVYNSTTEALLVIKEDDQIVFLNEVPPVIKLLDLKLPRIDDREVLQKIKSHTRYGTIPDVTLTTSSEDIDIKCAYEMGYNCYIVKPVNVEKFIKVDIQIELYWNVLNKQPKDYI